MTKYIEWDEPHYYTPNDASEDSENYLPITCRATVEDIVKFQRKREPRYVSDQEASDDFLVVYWGRYIED